MRPPAALLLLLQITVSPDKVLQISGERKYEKEEGSKEGEGVWRVERSYGSFVRRFRLPDNVDPEGKYTVSC